MFQLQDVQQEGCSILLLCFGIPCLLSSTRNVFPHPRVIEEHREDERRILTSSSLTITLEKLDPDQPDAGRREHEAEEEAEDEDEEEETSTRAKKLREGGAAKRSVGRYELALRREKKR